MPIRQISEKVLKDFDNEIIQIHSRREREIKAPDRLQIVNEVKKRVVKAPIAFVDYTKRRVIKYFNKKAIWWSCKWI